MTNISDIEENEKLAEASSSGASKSEPSSSSGKRLTEEEFQQARDLYETGKRTLIEIAGDLGISRQALSRRFKDAGVVKGSRAAEVATAGHKAAVAAAERYSDKRAAWIEETRLTAVNVLKQSLTLARVTLIENVKAKRPPAAIDDDIKTLSRYNRLLIDNIEATLRVLNADEHIDEDSLPELVIQNLTNEDVLKHHKDTGALPPDATVEDMLHDVIGLEKDK